MMIMRQLFTHYHATGRIRSVFVLAIIAVAFVLPAAAQSPLTEEIVQERLMQRRNMPGYQEGTKWDNSDEYVNTVEHRGYPPGYFTGLGCYGFMMDMMEYASNYEYPIRLVEATYDNLPEIHIGDGIRLYNDTHSVVVIEKSNDGRYVTVAEGNFNYSVHWGRIFDLSKPENGLSYILTFWPEDYFPTGVDNDERFANIRDIRVFSLTGTLVKRVTKTDMPVQAILGELPKGFYVVKEDTKTYKVYNKDGE